MTVAFERRTVTGVPLLLARHGPGGGAPRPPVLWFHGFRADSEAHRPELARVAAAGFLAVGVDAAGHGARRADDLAARIAAEGALAVMLDLATRTADEVPAVVDALAADGLADAARASAVGISMGGYLAYHAALVEPRLRTVVALLGSPEWPGGGPHRRLDAFRDVALLSITAEHDESVPPEAARRFHEALGARFGAGRRDAYHELRGAVHLMGAERWADAMDATLAWLARHGR